MENPGALAGAVGANSKADGLTNSDYRLRLERATSLSMTLRDAHPVDATAICVAFLEGHRAGDPGYTAFGDIRADAEFWADCAHPAELAAYFGASLKRLGRTPLGIVARKRLLVALWESLSDANRAAFLSWIDLKRHFTQQGTQ